MWRDPQFGPSPKDEAAARQELEDVVPRLEDLPLEGLPTPHDVAHRLFGLGRNPDRREFAGPIEPRQGGGVIAIVLALHAGALRDERRSDDLARIAPLVQRAVQHVAGAARLAAHPELALRGGAREPPLELHEVVRESIDARRRLRVPRQQREGDGLLVDVHPDVDD
jgi:hypothetical protein